MNLDVQKGQILKDEFAAIKKTLWNGSTFCFCFFLFKGHFLRTPAQTAALDEATFDGIF